MIDFKCAGCGTRLEIDDSAAGNKIKCPDCGLIGDVPGKDLPPMAFACNSCGHDLQVSAFQAGKLIPCPNCGCMVMVPPLQGTQTGKEGCLGLTAFLGLLLAAMSMLLGR